MIWSARGTHTSAIKHTNKHIHTYKHIYTLYSLLSDTENDQVFFVPIEHSLKESFMGLFKEVRTMDFLKIWEKKAMPHTEASLCLH